MHVRVRDGDPCKRVAIVIDSGAAENVIPRGWFGATPAGSSEEGIQFVGAGGKPLGNYGTKTILFVPESNPLLSEGFRWQASISTRETLQ